MLFILTVVVGAFNYINGIGYIIKLYTVPEKYEKRLLQNGSSSERDREKEPKRETHSSMTVNAVSDEYAKR